MSDFFTPVLNPVPQRISRPTSQVFKFKDGPVRVAIEGLADVKDTTLWQMMADDLSRLLNRPVELAQTAAVTFRLIQGPRTLPLEGYSLSVSPDTVDIAANDEAGLFYAAQTFVQLAATMRKEAALPCCEILDYPAYPHRWVMVDCGRAVYSAALLHRLVRLCARLKCNALHLHLNDNELNPVRYESSAVGNENPHALPVAKYGRLIDYARRYHVNIVPEVESWGHAGSLLQHAPHLYGATRLHGYGHSLGMGPDTLAFLGDLYDQWINLLPDNAWFHVGLDEGNFHTLENADPQLFNRKTMVQHVHRTLEQRAKAHNKTIRMAMWGGGFRSPDLHVPAELRDQILMVPWHYQTEQGAIDQMMRHWRRDTKRYNTQGQITSPFLVGGGTNAAHDTGCIEATCSFAIHGLDFPNCMGMNITNWGSNDIAGRLLATYFGAGAMWNPVEAKRMVEKEMALPITREQAIATIGRNMRNWQAHFPDVDAAAINADRGPEVLMGRYQGGPDHGEYLVQPWFPEHMRRGDQDQVSH